MESSRFERARFHGVEFSQPVHAPTQDGVIMKDESNFFPRGAVVFFASLIGFYAAFWLLLTVIMVSRG